MEINKITNYYITNSQWNLKFHDKNEEILNNSDTKNQMEIDSSINPSSVGIYDSASSNDKYNEPLESYEISSHDNDKLIKLILGWSYSKNNHHFEQPQITYQPEKIELEVIRKFFYWKIPKPAIIFDMGISELQFKNIVEIFEKHLKLRNKANMKRLGKSCKIKEHHAQFIENLI